ncbi:MAG: hypothetical protein V3U84_03760, partial [Thiotrichaceae bacterium]
MKEAIKNLESYCEWCKAQGGDCHAHLDGCGVFDTLTLLRSQPSGVIIYTEGIRKTLKQIDVSKMSDLPTRTLHKLLSDACDAYDRQAEELE